VSDREFPRVGYPIGRNGHAKSGPAQLLAEEGRFDLGEVSPSRGGGLFEVVGPTEYVAALRSLVKQLRNECAASGVAARAFGLF
jgi:hypothetical protein